MVDRIENCVLSSGVSQFWGSGASSRRSSATDSLILENRQFAVSFSEISRTASKDRVQAQGFADSIRKRWIGVDGVGVANPVHQPRAAASSNLSKPESTWMAASNIAMKPNIGLAVIGHRQCSGADAANRSMASSNVAGRSSSGSGCLSP